MSKSLAEIRELPAAELSEWIAYMRIEPLPDPNVFQAAICSAVTNAMCGAETTPETFRLLTPETAELLEREAKKARKPLTPEQTAGVLGRMLRGEDPCDSASGSKTAGRSSKRRKARRSRGCLG